MSLPTGPFGSASIARLLLIGGAATALTGAAPLPSSSTVRGLSAAVVATAAARAVGAPRGEPTDTTAVHLVSAGGEGIRAFRSGATREVVVVDPLLAERIRSIAARSPRFRASWAKLQDAGVGVLIGTREQVEQALPQRVRRYGGWAGLTVTYAGAGHRLERAAVAVRVDWLRQLHARYRNDESHFLEALDGLLVHELYGHLAPVVTAGDVRRVCADPEPGNWSADACVTRREREVLDELVAFAAEAGPAARAAGGVPGAGSAPRAVAVASR